MWARGRNQSNVEDKRFRCDAMYSNVFRIFDSQSGCLPLSVTPVEDELKPFMGMEDTDGTAKYLGLSTLWGRSKQESMGHLSMIRI